MDSEILPWVFLIGGIVMMLAEIVLPGGFAFVLGFSGLLVAALNFLGIVVDPATSIGIWVVSSIALTLALRPIFKKMFGGEAEFKVPDEDLEAMDQLVEVVEPINELDNTGRIRFQGISWQARSVGGPIEKGAIARIRYRDNTTWVVEYDSSGPAKLKESN